MAAAIAEFTVADRNFVGDILRERYLREVEPEPAEAELRLDPESEELTACPTLYWSERGAHFVVFKLPGGRFHCQFFYSENEQFGTGIDRFDDLGQCVRTLLQVQSDHERSRAGARSGATAIELADSDYFGPPVL
jgi:hypothetical protein